MTSRGDAPTLVGRAKELRALKSLVTGARNGISGAIVVRGEPGIGKTALLEGATADASEVTVVRSAGYEAESSIPYAALQRIGMALVGDVDALSQRHRQALRVAWGLDDGPPPERFLVGMAMLALLAEAGGRRPVLCVVDDAHWLDSESRNVLAFVGRRLQAESAVLLFASRDHDDVDRQFAGIEFLRLGGLDDVAAVQLLQRVTTAPIDNFAAKQIATATGGNPLALIDLANDLTVRRISDISLHLEPVPVGRRLEAHYLRQVAAMSTDVQQWLLVAAAEATGHARLIALAAKHLGVPNDCAAEAQRAGLITVGDSVVFRHPLVRSAIYGAAAGATRRQVHLELAHAAAEMGLVELEARNAAEGTTDFDTAVAARVEAVADRAGRRGGLMSQARLLARAADLTPKGSERSGRLLAAAESALEAGAAHLSIQLLDRLDPDSLDAVQRGRVMSARVFAAQFLANPTVMRGASAMMLQAAEQFHGHDHEREQKALLHAFELINNSDFLTTGTTMTELGHRLDAGARITEGVHACVLRALAALILCSYSDAVPLMRRALDNLLELADTDLLKFNYIGFIFSTALFDEAASEQYLDRAARVARDAGAMRTLDALLWIRSLFEVDRGDPSSSALYIEQVRELRRAIGFDAENVVNVAYLVWTGMPRDQVEGIGEIIRQLGFGGVYTSMSIALGIRDLAEGKYRDAYHRIGEQIAERFVQVTDHQLADYVEAAARSGHLADARRVAARLTEMAQASGTPWICGLDRRCQALLAEDTDAESHYLRAIEFLTKARTPSDLARAHLLYGEWLRRRKRRREARANLRTAVEIFDRINAPAMAQRARSEIAATGEKISEHKLIGGVEMSPREATVAQMAAHGATNSDIAASLFISTNTVDYHLRKVFGKLGISSRRQLADRLGEVK